MFRSITEINKKRPFHKASIFQSLGIRDLHLQTSDKDRISIPETLVFASVFISK